MLQQGDTVAYSAAFVRNIGGSTFELAERRGEVTEVVRQGFVRVRWSDEPDAVQLVCAANLAKPGSLRFGDCHA